MRFQTLKASCEKILFQSSASDLCRLSALEHLSGLTQEATVADGETNTGFYLAMDWGHSFCQTSWIVYCIFLYICDRLRFDSLQCNYPVASLASHWCLEGLLGPFSWTQTVEGNNKRHYKHNHYAVIFFVYHRKYTLRTSVHACVHMLTSDSVLECLFCILVSYIYTCVPKNIILRGFYFQ